MLPGFQIRAADLSWSMPIRRPEVFDWPNELREGSFAFLNLIEAVWAVNLAGPDRHIAGRFLTERVRDAAAVGRVNHFVGHIVPFF
ncbi:Uncharacterised protein [Mycobacteroides abscessus subsp. massiliense]|nr:Uncharacterised protein [Mycobacteroides abscessus subsp. abscessus]SKT81259.1 Uncharacterised protein [Mycobacteroides abscessus subsp. massiliense]SKT98915.1 Uncharacterised protein [Mycobacteroides abscessus subsp. massiliense]